MRALYQLVMPGGLVVLGAYLFIQILPDAEVVPPLARFVPSAFFAIGALLGARFHCSQMVLALLVLGLADWGFYFFASGELFTPPLRQDVLTALAFLMPLNFLWLCVRSHRGILTASTLSRLGFILAQPAAIAVVCFKWPGELSLVLDLQWLDLPWRTRGPVTQPGWLAFAGAFALLPAQRLVARDDIVGGLFWALIAATLAFTSTPSGAEFIVYMSAAGLALIASQVESSYLLAFRDDLTELPTRRALERTLAGLGRHYTIAMLDIDHFKKFNDTWGHQVGDQLLRMVGFKLAAMTGGGIAFRYGGEEFALVFPGKRLDKALPHVEAVRQAIQNTPFSIRSPGPRRKPRKGEPVPKQNAREKVSVTASIGVAQARIPKEVLRAADQALYRAKEAGRNRISR